MKATYIEFPSKGKVTVGEEEIDSSPLKPLEVLIENEVSVISTGTELARLQGLEAYTSFPARPGYGSIGRISQKGDEVEDFEIGDRVFYAGKHRSAERFQHAQGHQWGHLFRVPDGLDPVDAVMGCMAEIAMTAPNVTELALNDTVAVFGLGLVGNLAAQFYVLRGAKVFGVDPVKPRCELAQRCGIPNVIDAAPDKQVEALREATGGAGANVTVDATGLTPAVMNCIKSTADFGQVVLVGSPRAAMEGNLTEAFGIIHMKGIVVRGAHMWRYPVTGDRNVSRSVEWAFGTTFDLIAGGKLRVRELISHTVRPDEVPGAYQGLIDKPNDYTGVVIDWR